MRVGITGTRHGMTEAQLIAFEEVIPEECKSFHHGSCGGVDVEAARLTRKIFKERVHIVCHPGPEGDLWREISGVDDEIKEGKTHFARNRDIVNEVDLLIACPLETYADGERDSGGTWYTIKYARKRRKLLIIIWSCGMVRKEEVE